MSTNVTPVSFRVDAAQKKRIEQAAKADGYKKVGQYVRVVIIADLVDRDEDGRKPIVDETKTSVNETLTEDYKRLQHELGLKNAEMVNLKELLMAKDAHIKDLQLQVGFQMQQLALPPSTLKSEEGKKPTRRRQLLRWFRRPERD